MRFKSRRERILVFLTAILVVGVLGVMGFGRVRAKLADMDSQIVKYQLEFNGMERDSRAKQSNAVRYRRVKESLTIAGSDSEVMAVIRSELVELLNRTGFPTPEITARPPQPDREGFLTTYTFEIRGIRACSMRQLAEFLYEMEQSSDVLEIESINMQNPRMPREDSADGEAEFAIQQIEITRLVYSSV